MQIEIGTQARSQDGKDVGIVKNLILDPDTGQIKSVVLDKGLFLHEDVEIPLNAFESLDERDIAHLSYTAEQVHQASHFDPSNYEELPAEHTAHLADYLPGTLLWPITYPTGGFMPGILPPALPIGNTDAELAVGDTQIPEETLPPPDGATITVGSDVVDKNGEKVGEVHTVLFDTETGQMTMLVVRKGYLFAEHVKLPAHTIAHVHTDLVELNITREQMKSAPREADVLLF